MGKNTFGLGPEEYANARKALALPDMTLLQGSAPLTRSPSRTIALILTDDTEVATLDLTVRTMMHWPFHTHNTLTDTGPHPTCIALIAYLTRRDPLELAASLYAKEREGATVWNPGANRYETPGFLLGDPREDPTAQQIEVIAPPWRNRNHP